MYVRSFFGRRVQDIRDLYVGGRIREECVSGGVIEYQHQIEVCGRVITNVASTDGRVVSTYVVHFDGENRPRYEIWVGMIRGVFYILRREYKVIADRLLIVRRRANVSHGECTMCIRPIFEGEVVTGASIDVDGIGKGGRIVCEYDEAGRLRGERICGVDGLVVGDVHDSTEYIYDEKGRVVRMIDRQGEAILTVHHVFR